MEKEEILRINVNNRERLIKSVHEEMIGPVIDFNGAQKLSDSTSKSEKNNGFYYWEYGGTKEEVYIGGKPSKHYASGMIFPLERKDSLSEHTNDDANGLISEATPNMEIVRALPEENSIVEKDETISQNYLPSSFGITFALGVDVDFVEVKFNCGVYEEKIINSEIQEASKWWFRKSLNSTIGIDLKNIGQQEPIELDIKDNKNTSWRTSTLRLDTLVRIVKLQEGEIKIVTITCTNTTNAPQNNDKYVFFQCKLSVHSQIGFQSYPNASQLNANISLEDKIFDMLYVEESNFAFGQNCSTTWIESKETIKDISTTFLPSYEVKTMTPDIVIGEKIVEITHASLASAKDFNEIENILMPLINGYKLWYEKTKKIKHPEYYDESFNYNMKLIENAIQRMEHGLNSLKEKNVFEAFRLVNLVMFMQMANNATNKKRSPLNKATREIISDDGNIHFDIDYYTLFDQLNFTNFEALSSSVKKAIKKSNSNSFWREFKWRGFQIAFLLLSIDSVVNKAEIDSHREDVDLIWFPTGGGKTEAYLGVATLSMIYRRIVDKNDTGVDVLMRYTLRLLTADQFQRCARLVTSLDFLRKKMPDILGEKEFSIGLWVGRNNTPNTNIEARVSLKEYISEKKDGFPVSSCPWCGAQMTFTGIVYRGFKFSTKLEVYCPDSKCSFHEHLPIYFVDEQIYLEKPTFLIGTIDKFVQLTWKENARGLFGLDKLGNRITSPPNIIVQDELHLISGPLGTLAGIYECLIEELCTDRRGEKPILAKIISATATIKAYDSQIKALFGRSKSNLFPPSGIHANDNFFSTIQLNKDGNPVHGRKYVGVFPFTQSKLQTQVQTTSALISKVGDFEDDFKDPFWTILSFYNTINDIGYALTLTEQDIPSTLNNFYYHRNKKESGRLLHQDKVKELTSRMPSNEIVLALQSMTESYSKNQNQALDIVLASNIIEVGVDVDRLSLMEINGQPKTTAQYIQVSGRVGRKPDERPGLVIVNYNSQNSSDKSHYEHFIEYHQKLYSQVEESSVTPFSRFAITRGLPAILVGFIRQNFNEKTLGKKPDSVDLVKSMPEISRFMNDIIKRAQYIDPTEIKYIRKLAEHILDTIIEDVSYDDWQYKEVRGIGNNGFMAPMSNDQKALPDSVLLMINSMRSVDVASRLSVSKIIKRELPEEDAGVKTTYTSSESEDDTGHKGRYDF